LINSIRTVAQGLEPLGEGFVFVGGSIVECYVTSSAAEQARPTDDIDVVLELAHYGQYGVLQENLIKAGFNPDHTSKVICRYKYKGITVDIMPDDPGILGFTNRWYKDGIKNSTEYRIDESLTIKIFSAPFYLASKIEVYRQRGIKDKRLSTDFEDIVYVIENRQELLEEVMNSPNPVKEYIVIFSKDMLSEKDTFEAIAAVMGYAPMPQRIDHVNRALIKLTQIPSH
jgi:predicted nucleotidyltransferase